MTVVGKPPSDSGTRLAADRTRLAYERTMMAWVRTSTSLISFGFTIHKFFQYRVDQGQVPSHRVLGPGEFGGIMIGIGLVALALAAWDHQRSLKLLRAEYGPMPRSAAAGVGFLIFLLGIGALAVMMLGL
jgi:putative membrane protein